MLLLGILGSRTMGADGDLRTGLALGVERSVAGSAGFGERRLDCAVP